MPKQQPHCARAIDAGICPSLRPRFGPCCQMSHSQPKQYQRQRGSMRPEPAVLKGRRSHHGSLWVVVDAHDEVGMALKCADKFCVVAVPDLYRVVIRRRRHCVTVRRPRAIRDALRKMRRRSKQNAASEGGQRRARRRHVGQILVAWTPCVHYAPRDDGSRNRASTARAGRVEERRSAPARGRQWC